MITAAHVSSGIQWGDFPTWALAVIALLALIAAVVAYFKQADAARNLAEQVTIQRHQLRDQQQANSKQAEVLEAELRDLRQRTEIAERQQADAITLAAKQWFDVVPRVDNEWWGDEIRGVKPSPILRLHMAQAENGWHRPITRVQCRIQPNPGDHMDDARLVGHPAVTSDDPDSPATADNSKMDAGMVLALVRPGETGLFVFPYETTKYPDAKMTLRFTDDAGLHWQIDHDQHLEKLDNRDDW